MEKVAITKLINKVYEAVNESVLGDIVSTRHENGRIDTVNNFPYQVFFQVLGSELPHINVSSVKQTGNMDMKLEEPGDSWKK